MRRMLTMGTVHFQARASTEVHDRVMASADRANVPWHVAIKVISKGLLKASRLAATRYLEEIVEWSPQMWDQQEEVRIAKTLTTSKDGPE